MKIMFLIVSFIPKYIHSVLRYPLLASNIQLLIGMSQPKQQFLQYCIAETSQPPQAAGASSAMDTPADVSSKANSPSFFPPLFLCFEDSIQLLPDLIYILNKWT